MNNIVHASNPLCRWILTVCTIILLILLVTPLKISAQTGKTFTVNTLGDAADPNAGEFGDDGLCDTDPNTPGEQCTFRAAIQNHNGNRHLDHNRIDFNIPNAPGTGTIVIMVGSTGLGPLPPVLGSVSIQATSNSRRIELDGSQAGANAIGLQLLGGKCEITFFVINRFSSHGIFIAGTPPPGEGGHVLESNYIGTDETGTIDRGNGGDGIFIDNTPGSRIGGKGILGNVISANKGYGVHILGRDQSETGQPNGAHDIVLIGNIIGEQFTEEVILPNVKGGILNENAPNNTIGGSEERQGNTIMGTKNGVTVEGSFSKGVKVIGNFIGKDGTGAKFTAGIFCRAGEQLSIDGNIITNIDSVGIDIYLDADGSYNIRKNQVHGKVKVGAKFTFGPGRVIDVNYLNNLSFGNELGLQIDESINGTINWQILGDTAMNGQTGANLVFRAAGKKQLDNNHWNANAGIGFKYLCDFGAGVKASVLINGDVYARNGLEGFSGKVQLQTQAEVLVSFLNITGNNNGKDGVSLALAAFGGANAEVFFGGGSELSFNAGLALRLIGEKASLDLFKVSIENMDARGNDDLDAVFYLFDVRVGPKSFTNNTIMDNAGTAIVLDGSAEARIDSNTISGNGGGILTRDLATAIITNNTIDGNGKGVVLAGTSPGTLLSTNAIFNNAGVGIDLGNNGITANDAGDADTGPNNLQNFPVLTAVSSNGGNTTIQGTLNSTPNTAFKLEFFSNTTCSPSGFGEGQTFLGTQQVTTAANGNASFSALLTGVTLPAGSVVTSTATDPNNNTSEFSACLSTGNVQPADLELTKTADKLQLNVGDQVMFKINLVNKGPANATGIVVTDVLPAGITFNQATVSTGTYDNTTGKWQVGNLNSGSQATLVITGTATQTGSITNTAEITASGLPDPDSSPGNGVGTEDDQSSVTVTVVQDNNIEAQIIQLGLQVNALVASKDLTKQQGDILNALLGAALRFYKQGQIRAAIGTLHVFIGVVKIFMRSRFFHRLPKAKGNALIQAAQKIIAQLRAIDRAPASAIMESGAAHMPGATDRTMEEMAGIRLYGNYPNPFSHSTVISFELLKQYKVRLAVYDLHGKVVTQLLDATMPAGKHNINWQPANLPAGMYILRLDADNFNQTFKMMHTE